MALSFVWQTRTGPIIPALARNVSLQAKKLRHMRGIMDSGAAIVLKLTAVASKGKSSQGMAQIF